MITTSLAEPLRTFTAEEYMRLAEEGFFKDEKVELIDGVIVTMSPQGHFHSRVIAELIGVVQDSLSSRDAVVWTQATTKFDIAFMPEPDFVLLKPHVNYWRRFPTPADVLLLVEVANSSFRYDSEDKLPRYAELGVPEVWIVEIKKECVHVFRGPRADGYATHDIISAGGVVAASLLPAMSFDPARLFDDDEDE